MQNGSRYFFAIRSVTGLGEFSPFGHFMLHMYIMFLRIRPKFWTLYHRKGSFSQKSKVRYYILQNLGRATFCSIFFTKKSGHPARKCVLVVACVSCVTLVCCATLRKESSTYFISAYRLLLFSAYVIDFLVKGLPFN
jgi:tryptophan-rich sensory protein